MTEPTTGRPATVAGMEWPARCAACGLVTEDPDAHVMTSADEDAEYLPSHLCPATVDHEHEWARAPRVPDGDAVAALATATADALCFDGDECERMHEHLRNAASIVDALAAAGWALARTPEDR